METETILSTLNAARKAINSVRTNDPSVTLLRDALSRIERVTRHLARSTGRAGEVLSEKE